MAVYIKIISVPVEAGNVPRVIMLRFSLQKDPNDMLGLLTIFVKSSTCLTVGSGQDTSEGPTLLRLLGNIIP